MANITTRASKGSALTFAEGDANFVNLNTDKLEKDGGVLTGYSETVYDLGSTDSPSIDVANGNVQKVTISSGLSLPAFSNASAGQSVTLLVTGTGNVSGTADYIFANDSTTLSNKSAVGILYDGTNYWTSIATNFS